jgi:WD40 repeat protein
MTGLKHYVCCCADDRTVRLWSLETRRLVKKVSLLSTARAVAWSYDGKQIAVGLGGSASKGRQKLDGAVWFTPSL